MEKEVTLSIFSSRKHRQMSRFFHQMLFLQTVFAKRVKGPDLQRGKDRSLIRDPNSSIIKRDFKASATE